MSSVIFPPRRLGVSEDWGRSIENQISNLSKAASLTMQTLKNLERHASSRGELVSRQIQELWNASLLLQSQTTVLNERISIESTQSSVSVNSFGSQATVLKPEWASAGIVIASMSAISNPGTGWLARIDIYAETYPISSGDISENRVIAQGSMGYDPESPINPPDHLAFESLPGVRFFEDEEDIIYIRPYGLQVGGGSTSVTHEFELTFTVFWV